MSRVDCAAQFSPFAALTGYEDMIEEEACYVDRRKPASAVFPGNGSGLDDISPVGFLFAAIGMIGNTGNILASCAPGWERIGFPGAGIEKY